MKSVTVIVLDTIEETRQRFIDDHPGGIDPTDEKRLFINWYIENHNAPLRVLISDLSDYYLHISEDRIIRYLNEQKQETVKETP